MKNIKILLVLAGVVFSMMSSCKTPETISGYYSYETQCLGNLGDGTQLVKSWGTGLDRKQAEAQARKNALRDIMFKGIRNGNSSCEIRPLVVKPNALENYETYFNRFFSENGKYKSFVSLHREPFLDRNFKSNTRSDARVAYGLELKVRVDDLRRLLIKDEIIE